MPTTDWAALDVRQLQRFGALVPGETTRCTELTPGSPEVLRVSSVGTHVSLGGQWVKLDYTMPNYGGRRPWFLCGCGKRVAILYRVGKLWRCRVCSDLDYQTQHEDQFARAYRRLGALHERLGTVWSDGFFPPPAMKPPGMWWSTFFRLQAQISACYREMLADFGEPGEVVARLQG